MTKTIITYNWSTDFEGKSVMEILANKPKMTYKEILNVIKNEGGYINEDAIVCKGTARDKVVEL